MRKFLYNFPLHTFLFVFFISLFLFAQNTDHVEISMMTRTLLIGSLASLLIFSVFYLFTRNRIKAGIMSTMVLLILFHYGVMYDVIEYFYYAGLWPFKNIHRYLIVLTVLFCVFLIWIINKKTNTGKKLNYFFNVLIIILMVFNTIRVVSRNLGKTPPEITVANARTQAELPNLYYIILDGYANHNMLKKHYEYDNSDFISFLRSNGFYVADSAISNYYSTGSSLASTFNFDYSPEDSTFKLSQLNDNRFFKILKANGYKLFNLESGYSVTSNFPLMDSTIKINAPNEFERSILKFTIFRLDDLFGTIQHSRLKSQFEKLDEVARLSKQRKFVFVHIVAPHPPYVFNSNGEQVVTNKNNDNHWEPKENYIEQLIYVNKIIKQFVLNIIDSDKNSLIILQSDHGPWVQSKDEDSVFEARSMILNAQRYPLHKQKGLYNSISSVNTFRYFIKNYIDTSFSLIPDRPAGKKEITTTTMFKEKKHP